MGRKERPSPVVMQLRRMGMTRSQYTENTARCPLRRAAGRLVQAYALSTFGVTGTGANPGVILAAPGVLFRAELAVSRMPRIRVEAAARHFLAHWPLSCWIHQPGDDLARQLLANNLCTSPSWAGSRLFALMISV